MLLSAAVHVDHSIFVGDLAPEVTDYMLQEHFRQYYPSVRSAKVSAFSILHSIALFNSIQIARQHTASSACGTYKVPRDKLHIAPASASLDAANLLAVTEHILPPAA